MFGKLLRLLGFGENRTQEPPLIERPIVPPTPVPPVAPLAPPPPLLEEDWQKACAWFDAWQDENALPAVFLQTSGTASSTKDGSRFGGPAWIPEGSSWPVDGSGKRLAFLAQLDFAQLPNLPDYPTTGVLQFFIGRDDLYGCNFDRPEEGDFKLVWHEDMDAPGAMQSNVVQTGTHDDYTPLSDSVLEHGLALSGSAGVHKPGWYVWHFERDLSDIFSDLNEADPIYDHADEKRLAEGGDRHHIGGHPEFTQLDYRGVEGYQDVDRVLLNIWSQSDARGRDQILWGDSGQGQFTIRREDLLKRDFSKACYQFDCC